MDEKERFVMRIGAETGRLEGALFVSRDRPGYSDGGYVTGFRQRDGDRWSVRVYLPETRHYTLTVRCAADTRRVCHLLVNGADVGMCVVAGDGVFHEVRFPAIWLEKGETELSVLESWGWFDLDRIDVYTGERLPSTLYRGKPGKPVNPGAGDKTRRILRYLTEHYGKQTLAGQYANHGSSREIEALHALTGAYPAIRGFDFIQDCPVYGGVGRDTALAADWSRAGGLVTFSWHWAAPLHGADFYTKNTRWNLSDAMTGEDVALLPPSEIGRLRRQGRISEETALLVRDIDTISEKLKILRDQDVTVLWRPLHEASGGWFWWGARGAEAYRWLWRLLYTRQTVFHRLDNLLWVWNGEDAAWYVGDDWCDILGEDIYTLPQNTDAQAKRLADTAAISAAKPVAMTEAGVMPDPVRMARDGVFWSWFTVWCREFIVDAEGRAAGTYTDLETIQTVYKSDMVITLDKLPVF